MSKGSRLSLPLSARGLSLSWLPRGVVVVSALASNLWGEPAPPTAASHRSPSRFPRGGLFRFRVVRWIWESVTCQVRMTGPKPMMQCLEAVMFIGSGVHEEPDPLALLVQARESKGPDLAVVPSHGAARSVYVGSQSRRPQLIDGLRQAIPFRYDFGHVREAHSPRGRGECQTRRPRGPVRTRARAHRSAASSRTRSSCRSGDSGSDGPGEPGSPSRALAGGAAC